jgi:hypothetical protein
VVEGEVSVWLTSSDLGRTRFLSQGVWQGLSFDGGREKLGATTLHFQALIFIDVIGRDFPDTHVLLVSMDTALSLMTWTVTYMNYTL